MQKKAISAKYAGQCRDRIEGYIRDLIRITKIIVKNTTIEEEIDEAFENAVDAAIAAIPKEKLYEVYTYVDAAAQIIKSIDIIEFATNMLDTMDDIPYEFIEYEGNEDGKWLRSKITDKVLIMIPDKAIRGVISGIMISCKPLMKAYEYLAKLIYKKDRRRIMKIVNDIVAEMKASL